MPRKRTASARMRKVMAARIARPATIAAPHRSIWGSSTTDCKNPTATRAN